MSTRRSMDAFAGGIWIILGGKDKHSDYTALRQPLRAEAKAALLIGSAADKIAPRYRRPRVEHCGTFAAAVQQASARRPARRQVRARARLRQLRPVQNFEQRGRVSKI